MPQLGESVTEGTVEKWLKKEGDFVKRDEPIVEVVTDKVNAEIPSPFEGTLVKIEVEEGTTVAVGTLIARIDTGGDGAVEAPAEPVAPEPQVQPEAEMPAEAPQPESQEAPPAVPQAAPTPAEAEAGSDARPRFSPAVRRLAE